MVVMFVDCCVCGLRYFLYYSYCRNPTGREFFDRARTLIAVNLLSSRYRGKPKSYKWKYGGRRPFFLSFIKTRLHNFYSIRRPWRNAETSPTAPCAPLASIPDRPPPSSRLVRRRMPLVQPKSAGKCLNTIHLARRFFDEGNHGDSRNVPCRRN